MLINARKVLLLKTLKKIIITVAVVLYSLIIITFPRDISQAIVKSINVCINVIIPSMFIFMVISSYILSSNLYNMIFSPIYFLFKRIIKLDKQSFSIFLLSLIGGYPVGLKLIREEISQNKNYHEIAGKTAAFCYCISPSFAITMIGIELYKNAEFGFAVYISNVISNFILAVIYSHKYDLKITLTGQTKTGNIISSVNSSAATLFKICSIIIFFNSIIASVECLLNCIGVSLSIEIKSLLEISNILEYQNITPVALPFIAGLTSTGGFCVIFQSISIVNVLFVILVCIYIYI